MFDQAISFLREFGFPIFVCVWFMRRLELRMDVLMSRINKLIAINAVMHKTLDLLDTDDVEAVGLEQTGRIQMPVSKP